MLRILVLLLLATACLSVDRSNFKTCDQSAFCKRHRSFAQAGEAEDQGFVANLADAAIRADRVLLELTHGASQHVLVLELVALASGAARVRLTDKSSLHERHVVKDVLQEPLQTQTLNVRTRSEADLSLVFGEQRAVVINARPFRVDFFVGTDLAVSINSRSLLRWEQYREKQDDAEPGMWEETFKTHHDSKPRGPSSVGIDISFPGVEHVYGIPEHATALSLPATEEASDPYRLYNLDVFEYELDNPMALYGSIPYMVAHRPGQTSGLLFLNSAEMWIDVRKAARSKGFTGMLRQLRSLFQEDAVQDVPQTDTHWMAESGIIDLFVLLGPQPKDVFSQYAVLTGKPALPPLFSLAYHQCRWNYNDEADVAMVSRRMEEENFPVDVIWLDIEHTDGKRYMTWDAGKFPSPEAMQTGIAKLGRKMVNIVDPHIKRVSGYQLHEQATALGHYVKNKDNNDYDGWCWPGSSSWLDYMNPAIRSWWADQFAFDKYKGTTEHMYFWNDMNEPSVFNGPEITMHKDAKHYGGWEHRDVHNIYGMWQQASTAEGIIRRSGGKERPFVLSRAFFVGSQRYGAIWTGDNKADWDHLRISIPMVLSIGVAGLPFAGADIGGFFGNPDAELLVRWYQVGAFYPFMRAHAHLDTRRREPYLLEEPMKSHAREAIISRYTHLAYIYSVFYDSHLSGVPVMRPLWVEFPEDAQTFAEQVQFLVGSDLLVTPVVAAGVTSVDSYFPGSQPWMDIQTYQMYQGSTKASVDAPLSKIPVFQRAGSIIPRKMRVRRSSQLSLNDPFTLVAVVDPATASATGTLYLDDYHSVGSPAAHRRITLHQTGDRFLLNSRVISASPEFVTSEWLERVVVVGLPDTPQTVSFGNQRLGFVFDAVTRRLEIKKPGCNMGHDFEIVIQVSP